MKNLLFVNLALIISSSAFADFNSMMKIYNNPNLAPKVAKCHNNTMCNGFIALAQQWQNIPSNYRYKGSFDIKKQAKVGDGYGLNKGYYMYTDRAVDFKDVGDNFFWKGGSASKADEAIFGRGLAVLMFIEDKNGWAKDKPF